MMIYSLLYLAARDGKEITSKCKSKSTGKESTRGKNEKRGTLPVPNRGRQVRGEGANRVYGN